jgi:hypothetical protein
VGLLSLCTVLPDGLVTVVMWVVGWLTASSKFFELTRGADGVAEIAHATRFASDGSLSSGRRRSGSAS